ncbi:MAG: hypothetical protein WCR52_02570 [Bacteroidota bacterium]
MKFVKKLLFLIIFLAFGLAGQAQSLRSYVRAGDDAFKKNDFGTAIQQYAIVLKQEGENAAVLWKYAECARLIFAYPEAEKAYLTLLKSEKQLKRYPLLKLRLGQVVKGRGDYVKAIEYLEDFIANAEPADQTEAKAELEACKYAMTLSKAETNPIEIKHLGKEINSPYSDFAPFVVGDTLFFSSYRFDQKSDRSKPKHKITKEMISIGGGRAREPGRGFPTTDTAHIANMAFSPDGHYVFFTICKNINARDIRCELWLTVIDRRNHWLPPVRLPEPINLPGYTTTQPSIAYDKKAEGPVLWFASDRPGGKGKMDLWYLPLDTVYFCPCALPLPGKKIPHLPKFNTPINAASINTTENEATPFFHAPTQKLYFASEGWNGLGGYDLFTSEKKGDEFSKPLNLGLGFNSSYNDLYPFISPDGLRGYISSNRPGSFYLDESNKSCCNDLYSFKITSPPPPIEKPKQPEPDSVPKLVAKQVSDGGKAPVPLPVFQEPVLQDFVGLPLYFDNDEPDKRTNRTSTKKSYDETVQAYLERQAEYKKRFGAGLTGVGLETAENSVDDFFENEVRRGNDRLQQLCDLLLTKLQSGQTVEVIIKGYTSPRARSDYNLNLGKRRISSVRNQFDVYADGALLQYIRAGKLKISETSFGETTVRRGVSDDLRDERNSIYHPEAARERRVEIIEIREKE